MTNREEKFSKEELKAFKDTTLSWFLMHRVIENIPENTFSIEDISHNDEGYNFLLQYKPEHRKHKAKIIKPKYKIGDIIAIKDDTSILAYGKITSIEAVSSSNAIHSEYGTLNRKEFFDIRPNKNYDLYESWLWIYRLELIKTTKYQYNSNNTKN